LHHPTSDASLIPVTRRTSTAWLTFVCVEVCLRLRSVLAATQKRAGVGSGSMQAAAEREASEAAAAVARASHGASTSGAAVLLVCPPTPLVQPQAMQPEGALQPRPPLRASSALLSHPVLGAALRSARVRSGVASPSSVAPPAVPGAASPSSTIQGNRAEQPQSPPQPRPPQQPSPSGAPSAAAAAVATAAAAASGERVLDDEDDSLCVVCLDARRSVTLLPCHHRVLCAGCLAGVRETCNEVRYLGGWLGWALHWGCIHAHVMLCRPASARCRRL
jgi:hypothetical protein